MTDDVEHLFMNLLAIDINSLIKNLGQNLLIGLFGLPLNCNNYLHIIQSSPLLDNSEYILPFAILFYNFLGGVF